MKVTRISVNLSKTVQAVTYEPVSVSFSMDAELEAGDTVKEARAALYEEAARGVRLMMKKELRRWREEHDEWHEENS
ncbi:TPA: hypothetical protein ACP7Q5_004961 [Escherichia coli]|jgi:hypothetical protein|uniref:Uncharacterized protein n=1 Tax=Myoviridae sp. ctu2j3 TaxID=2825197 RepID=A0A8S5UIK5_9CAUD|nr:MULTISPECIES: hypothetical protein [Enterococcus]ELG7156121.1 hypothetical protein [Staphylococcus aureus]DAF94177.1 MAG TPA: hypothetical protein [Myoviridae sp. ctu2j3]ELL1201388.1 hypothetical protein [Staphylococcus aureus]MDN3040758.1 hypothetical protein [Enterococcus faecium]MDN3104125.1 hypothetical protein [Enterococcus faecalis]